MTLDRFVKGYNSITMAENDDPIYRQIIEEVIDFINDNINDNKYAKRIQNHFDEGISNFIGSPSYKSVENIIGVIGAIITRVERNTDILNKRRDKDEPEANPITTDSKNNINDIYANLSNLISECKSLSEIGTSGIISNMLNDYTIVLNKIHESWSGSYLGYHTLIYIKDFEPKKGGDVFDSEWRECDDLSRTQGSWVHYSAQDVNKEINTRSGNVDKIFIEKKCDETKMAFDKLKAELLPILEVLIENESSSFLESLREKLLNLKSHISNNEALKYLKPNGPFMSRDSLAVTQGVKMPPHLIQSAWILERKSYFTQCQKITELADTLSKYLSTKKLITPKGELNLPSKLGISQGQLSSFWIKTNPLWIVSKLLRFMWKFKICSIIIIILGLLAIDYSLAWDNLKWLINFIKTYNF